MLFEGASGSNSDHPPLLYVALFFTPHQHPKFVTLKSRLATFHTWPIGLKQQPVQMAKAGFFYEGVSDHVKCFSCDGGLDSWEERDSPEEEHAKWFPGCTYLLLIEDDENPHPPSPGEGRKVLYGGKARSRGKGPAPSQSQSLSLISHSPERPLPHRTVSSFLPTNEATSEGE